MKRRCLLITAFISILTLGVAATTFAQADPAIHVSIWQTHLKPGDAYPFKNIPAGAYEDPESVKITNTGKAALTFTGMQPVTVSGPDASVFVVLDQPSGELAPGAHTYFNLRYIPRTSGINNATVTIATNDPATPSFTFRVQAFAWGRHLETGFLFFP